jgi:MULE transposase domain/SWIM zinc finger
MLERKPLLKNITNLRSELVKVFASDGAASETTSRVVRSCFPQLNGSSILDSFGVEVVSKTKEVPVTKVLPAVTKRWLRSDGVNEVTVTKVTKRRLRSNGVDEVMSPVSKKKEAPVTKLLSVTKRWLRSDSGDDKKAVPTVPEKKVPPVTNVLPAVVSAKRRLRSDSDLSGAATVLADLAIMAEVHQSQIEGTDSVVADIAYDTETEATNDNKDAENGDHDDDEYDNVTESLTAESGAGETKQGRSSADSSTDRRLYDILNDANIECFSTLEDAIPFIEQYEIRSGNHLRVQRSVSNKFKQFQCMEHMNCPFQVLISKRRSDAMFCVSKIKGIHSEVRRPARAADGRQWKKRRHATLDGIIGQVVRTKQGAPTPADVMKTAAMQSGMIVPYMTAYRALSIETSVHRHAAVKNFQLIIPFLNEMKKCNPGSVIGYTRDNDMKLEELHFFPGIMNRALKFVRPVVSLDAAHLRSRYKGTLYVATVLTGCNDIFPIGFMISAGNEDGDTWKKMLQLLKEACPIIDDQGYGDTDTDGVVRPPFLFISDRDKGLKPALKAIFPNKYEMSCAKHIEANVAQKFGKQCAKYVCSIAKTFSTRASSYLFDEIRKVKPEAAAYLDNLTESGVLWRSTQWHSNSTPPVQIPPRYGIVTSNTSESPANSMFSEARDLGWLEAVSKIVDIMSTRVCVCRKKYAERDGSEVVPRVAQILKRRWDSAASMTVNELEVGCGDFKVVEPTSIVEEDGDENVERLSRYGDQNRIVIVKPDSEWCSCGVWQDFLYPCRHACAVFRKWKEREFSYVLGNLVHPFYTFEFVHNSFTKNVFPVCLETIEYDGETKEPKSPRRQAGRPQKKRIRKRSKFVEVEESPVTCSICGKRGHNRRTCPSYKY